MSFTPCCNAKVISAKFNKEFPNLHAETTPYKFETPNLQHQNFCEKNVTFTTSDLRYVRKKQHGNLREKKTPNLQPQNLREKKTPNLQTQNETQIHNITYNIEDNIGRVPKH